MVLMHGQLLKARCVDTQETFDWFGNLDVDTPHPKNPQMLGRLRPDIVWFGEMPIGMEIVEQHLADCDLFVAIGTSGVVYPAAGFVQLVPSGCRSIEINIEQGPASHLFFDTIRGLATVEVPRFLNRLVSAW
jgi:NAD-dependent deacetylase